ncbi:MAG: NAD(P)H-binding protein [Caldisericia bacterium]|nr:NAD(P)H-binding protein [Caldisericia bacterium]MDD4614865.1 NAD(P)H-binding protein [Caldisericia bacterium]
MKSVSVTLTGAFSYTGRYIGQELLRRKIPFQSLTNHPRPSVFPSASIPVAPLQFQDAPSLIATLRKSTILVNTYWIRYPAKGITHETAVQNIGFLVQCAKQAGIQKIIHISVSNPSIDSQLSYFKGKAEAEEIVQQSGIPYTILRPTLVFGKEDVLLHNIAWLLRHFPFFMFPSPSTCLIQPISAEEVGYIAVESIQSYTNQVVDVAGPEVLSMKDMVQKIGHACGYPRPMYSTSLGITMGAVRILNTFLRDRIITEEEILGLLTNHLVSSQPSLGRVSFTGWLMQEGSSLCSQYINDYKRFFGQKN